MVQADGSKLMSSRDYESAATAGRPVLPIAGCRLWAKHDTTEVPRSSSSEEEVKTHWLSIEQTSHANVCKER